MGGGDFRDETAGRWAGAFHRSRSCGFFVGVEKKFFGFRNRGSGEKEKISSPKSATHCHEERCALLAREFFISVCAGFWVRVRFSVCALRVRNNPVSAEKQKRKKLLPRKKLVGFVFYKSFDFVAAHAFHARSRDCRREIFPVAFCQHSRVEHADYPAVARGAD